MSNNFTSTWAEIAPIIIIFIIAIFAFVAVHRATKPKGWYSNINHPFLEIPTWLQVLLWIVVYVFVGYVWYFVNANVTDIVTFDILNWLLVCHFSFSFVFWLFFYGDGNVIVGLVMLLLMLGTLVAILYYVIANVQDVLSISFVTVYLAWLLYVLYLNIGILAKNKLVTAPFRWDNLLPW